MSTVNVGVGDFLGVVVAFVAVWLALDALEGAVGLALGTAGPLRTLVGGAVLFALALWLADRV